MGLRNLEKRVREALKNAANDEALGLSQNRLATIYLIDSILEDETGKGEFSFEKRK